jgi:hypothetical protein
MTVARVIGALGLGVVLLAGVVTAGVDPADTCRDRKGKTMGAYALNLLRAHGKNTTSPDPDKLAADIAKAESKLATGFTRAEVTGAGEPKGCATTGDADTLATKAEVFVDDVVDALTISP